MYARQDVYDDEIMERIEEISELYAEELGRSRMAPSHSDFQSPRCAMPFEWRDFLYVASQLNQDMGKYMFPRRMP